MKTFSARSAAACTILLGSLARAATNYTTDTTLTSDASLGTTSIGNDAALTIQSGAISMGAIYLTGSLSGHGHLIVNGGSVSTASSLEILPYYNKVGEVVINGGSFSAAGMYLRGRGLCVVRLVTGALKTTFCQIGDFSASEPVHVQIDGGVWTNDGTIMIGALGEGQMEVNGGTVNTSALILGNVRSPSRYTQTGGSLTTGNFYFGNKQDAPVSATVSGGVLTAETSRVGYNGAGGVITLQTGGVFATGQALLYNVNAGIYFQGGTVRATHNQVDWIAGFVSGTLLLQTAGGTVDTQSYDVGIAGPFTGAGTLTKTGTGTLTLSGANAHTGGTVVADGTLALAGSVQLGTGNVTVNAGGTLAAGSGTFSVPGILGSGAVSLASGGTMIVCANNASTTFSGTVIGAGEFSKTGTGTFTFTGNATHTGGTSVRGGTVLVAPGGAINTPGTGIAVANSGTGGLVLGGGTVAVSSIILGHDGGTGTLTLNEGTLTTIQIARWSAPSSIAFNGGTVRAAADTTVLLSGFTNGSAVIQSGGLIIDTNGFTVSTPAEFTGAGDFVKTGAGTLNLTGFFAHTGPTIVNGGTLSLSSARLADAGKVSIASGAALNLAFTGADIVSTLTLDGVLYTTGSWGAIGSGAQHETVLITGTGRLLLLEGVVAWLALNGLSTSSALDDDDHDGQPNLLEYFCGSNPLQNNSLRTAAVSQPAGIQFSFDRRKGADFITAIVEWSDDLTTWTTTGVGPPAVTSDQGTTERVNVTVPLGAGIRRFVRLHVSPP